MSPAHEDNTQGPMRSPANPQGQVLGARGLQERLGVKPACLHEETRPHVAQAGLELALVEDDPALPSTTSPGLGWWAFTVTRGFHGSRTEPRAFCPLGGLFPLSPDPDLLLVCLFIWKQGFM